MAHQAHNIPWNQLASNFHYVHTKRLGKNNRQNVTNLYPLSRPNRAKELVYFVEAFVRTIEEHSECERKKFPQVYDAPEPDDIVLSEAVVRQISSTVFRQRLARRKAEPSLRIKMCPHKGRPNCGCPISFEERKMSTFLHRYQGNDCYQFFRTNTDSFYGLQIVETLLLYDQMDTVFRICSHPEVDYRVWWQLGQCYCCDQDIGWGFVCKRALHAYLCLNLLYCFPELWDFECGRAEKVDYRLTRGYQDMLHGITLSDLTDDVSTYPHRQFFGIAEGQFHPYRVVNEQPTCPLGMLPIEEFIALEGPPPFLPTPAETHEVQSMFINSGLPLELALEIMEMADYTPQRRLKVPNDPLHKENSEELRKYLTYCWRLLVNCDLMAKASGQKISWDKLVSQALCIFWLPRNCYKIEYLAQYLVGESVKLDKVEQFEYRFR